MMDFSKSKLDIIGKSKFWLALSGISLLVSLIAMGYRTVQDGFPLKRGIDFEGGSIIQLEFENWGDKETGDFQNQVNELVTAITEKEPSVQVTRDEDSMFLHIRADSSLVEKIDERMKLYEDIRSIGGDFKVFEESEVGAVIGKELSLKALQGVLLGLFLILIYITIRLSLDFGVFAIAALAHDVLILCGVFALFGLEINSPWVAIMLTVVGYSINDTIVIYDRIRENLKIKRHLPFDVLVNQSLLETMVRSINTGMCTLLTILAIGILGGVSLRTFMIGLGVGITAGTYSSMFVASTLLVTWRLRGKGSVPLEEKPTDFMREVLSNSDEEMDDEEYEVPELISVSRAPDDLKKPRKKARRRKRRQ